MLHACQRPGPVIAVLMSRGDDCAMVLAGFVDSPPHLVGLTPDLHDSLVLMPAADFPDVMVGGQLVLNIPGVDVVPSACAPFADEGYFQIRVRGDRAGRSLCVPPCGPEGDCEEGRQNSSGNEA